MTASPSTVPTRGTEYSAVAQLKRRTVVLSILLALGVALLMRWPLLHLPLERDEGAYGYLAKLWLQGGLPYRDAFDHKPPLLYLLYMPPLLVAPPSAFAIRVWVSLLFCLQLPILWSIARALWDRSTATVALLIYAVAGSSFSLQGMILNTEQALVLPALLAIWALVHGLKDARLRWPFLYGTCIGLLALIKPTAAPFLVPLILLSGARGMRGRVMSVATMSLGIIIPWLIMLAIWGLTGAFDTFWFAVITYNRLYLAEGAQGWTIEGLINMLAPLAPLIVCAIGGASLSGWRHLQERQRTLIVLWSLAFFVAALISLRGYIHYYYPILPGLALLAAPSITGVARHAQQGIGPRITSTLAALLVLAVVLGPFIVDNIRVGLLEPTTQAERLYGNDGRLYFAPAEDVATYLQAHTHPDEPIYVWASEPEIYLFAQRQASSRYIYIYPIDLIPGALDEVLQDLRQHPPGALVLYHGLRPAGLLAIADEMGLKPTKEIGGYDIWTRSAAGAR